MLSGRWMILFLATFFLAKVDVSAGQDPQVRSPAGTFRGKVLTAPSGARYESYRGIPYALPPTGERRFAVPEPYPVIEGVYEATDFGPVCFQILENTVFGQEDCLFVNVFTPLSQGETGSGLKSVLVFIHGGGYILGSSNIYLPGDLVTKADIVVVTMNYRLGLLGFLHGNSDSLPGNQGYLDQVMALRWVKDNIRAFGGDPDDVTLSGQSSGSSCTSVLSISPLGKDLFNKAILMSPARFSLTSQPRTSNTLLEMLSLRVGCAVKPVAGNEESVVRCLKQEPVLNLYFNLTAPVMPQLTTSGDQLLPRSIHELLNDYTYLSDVGFFSRDYFLSVTKHDGYNLVNSLFGKIDTSSFDSSVKDLAKSLHKPEYLVRLLLTEYGKLYEDLETSVLALVTDDRYINEGLRFLEVYGKNPNQGKTSNNAYFMSLDYSPRYTPNNYMIPAFNLVYLFDVDPNQIARIVYFFEPKETLNEEDIQLKSYFIDLIATFIKPGSRKTTQSLKEETHIVWPPFDTDKKSYLSFSLYPSVREDILASRRYIWDTLVPEWIQESQLKRTKEY